MPLKTCTKTPHKAHGYRIDLDIFVDISAYIYIYAQIYLQI